MKITFLRIAVITALAFITLLSVYEQHVGRPLPLWAWVIWGFIYVVEWIMTAATTVKEVKEIAEEKAQNLGDIPAEEKADAS